MALSLVTFLNEALVSYEQDEIIPLYAGLAQGEQTRQDRAGA